MVSPPTLTGSCRCVWLFSSACTGGIGRKEVLCLSGGPLCLDDNAYILEALQGSNAPEFVGIEDVMSCYANIQGNWLMRHIPMDKKVLAQFLKAGHVFAGELFPSEEVGISMGANLYPMMANHVLDGLRAYIFQMIYPGTQDIDYANGNLVRFADDIFFTARTRDDAEQIIEYTKHFLAERGLTISEEKTKVVSVYEGFDFISRHYVKENGAIHVTPSTAAVNRIRAGLKELILTHNRSQKNLIDSINRQLSGWASYHRYSDAKTAFKEIDGLVDNCLWVAALARHP
ncbi:hypothetical protein ADH66_01065 [Acutalibacter muris]|uniref:Reverse transcriptase domain-containing protein n=3 Tax=Acutalibacter muris TaxID=1796620 RepID=A0ABM6L275_9FIRM|nr:hypothetical protein A4V00_07905 [Hungateiclostridiaceae bacterium KB18]ASB39370.1 hypothetical protein ADH66_01065 [Acutalibacter muris]